MNLPSRGTNGAESTAQFPGLVAAHPLPWCHWAADMAGVSRGGGQSGGGSGSAPVTL